MDRDKLDTLKTDLETWAPVRPLVAGQDYEAVAAAYNERPLVANPKPQPQVPRRVSWGEALATMGEEERLAVYEREALTRDLQAALAANDRQALADLVPVLRGVVSQAALSGLAALLAQTEPDPTWQAQVPGPSRGEALGLGTVRARDVQAALHYI